MESILSLGLESLGLTPPRGALGQFELYYQLLEERGRVMNLTAIKGREDTARLHFLDCAALLPAASFSGRAVIDIGTGAGFPGIPLKILCPGARLTLLDSQRKRINFVTEVCSALGFDDTVCLHARAELPPPGLRETMDIAVTRAVSRLNILCELALPFVRPGGRLMAMKGPLPEEELEEAQGAIDALGGKAGQVYKYTIPGTEITHSIVFVEKLQKTPEKYPRPFARIQKSPL